MSEICCTQERSVPLQSFLLINQDDSLTKSRWVWNRHKYQNHGRLGGDLSLSHFQLLLSYANFASTCNNLIAFCKRINRITSYAYLYENYNFKSTYIYVDIIATRRNNSFDSEWLICTVAHVFWISLSPRCVLLHYSIYTFQTILNLVTSIHLK